MSVATVTADDHAHAPAAPLPQAVALTVDRPDDQSRALAIFRFVLLIPQAVAILVLSVIWALSSVVGGLAVLITGRYPKSLWTFNVGVLRWFARVWAYTYFPTSTRRSRGPTCPTTRCA